MKSVRTARAVLSDLDVVRSSDTVYALYAYELFEFFRTEFLPYMNLLFEYHMN